MSSMDRWKAAAERCRSGLGRLRAGWEAEAEDIDIVQDDWLFETQGKAERAAAEAVSRWAGALLRVGGAPGRCLARAFVAAWDLAMAAAICLFVIPQCVIFLAPIYALDSMSSRCEEAAPRAVPAIALLRLVLAIAFHRSMRVSMSLVLWLGMAWAAQGVKMAIARSWGGGGSPGLPAPGGWAAAWRNVALEMMSADGGPPPSWPEAGPGEDGLGRIRALGLHRAREPLVAWWAACPVGICGAARLMRRPAYAPVDLIRWLLDGCGGGASPEEIQWLDWAGSLRQAGLLGKACPPLEAGRAPQRRRMSL